jgi:hypothetical protein
VSPSRTLLMPKLDNPQIGAHMPPMSGQQASPNSPAQQVLNAQY